MANDQSKPTMHHGTRALQRAFLAAYEITMNVSHAAAKAGIDRDRHYKWLARFPKYRAKFNAARDRVADALEAEAVRRAMNGLSRKKFHNGAPILDPDSNTQYVENEYSDTLLIFILKGLRPDVYRDAVKPITVNINELVKSDPSLASASPPPGSIPALPPADSVQDGSGGTPGGQDGAGEAQAGPEPLGLPGEPPAVD